MKRSKTYPEPLSTLELFELAPPSPQLRLGQLAVNWKA